MQHQRAVSQPDNGGRRVDVEAVHGVVLHTVDIVRLLVHHLGAGEAVLLSASALLSVNPWGDKIPAEFPPPARPEG